jgi:hypothetical protein
MKSLNAKLELLTKHLKALDKTFLIRSNYSDPDDYSNYKLNHKEFENLAQDTTSKYSNIKISSGQKDSSRVNLSFSDEIYHQDSRQMKLADIIEYLFFSRGIYFIFQSNSFRPERVTIYLKLILRYVNLLMIFENVTVDKKLRNALLENLEGIIKKDIGYKELKKWKDPVGLPKSHPRQKPGSPNEFFDSILPKTAGGLWHEMLVFAFILKYDIGYIFPLLLTQKPISLENKLSPPDLIVLHNSTFRYYGIEIGNLKERQSGGFMAPSGIPVIPLDTLNARISDRCPSCSKWIGICEKVIEDFSNTSNVSNPPPNEIRCLTDCNKFSLKEKLEGKCSNIKFKYESKIDGVKYDFADGKHHHYKCCIKKDSKIISSIKNHKKFNDLVKLNTLILKNEITEDEANWKSLNYPKIKKAFNFLKTHSVYYSELISLIEINNTISNNAE